MVADVKKADEFIDRANQLMIELDDAVRKLTAVLLDRRDGDASDKEA